MITTTLEQSRRLKELGAPQDTYFCWYKDKSHAEIPPWIWNPTEMSEFQRSSSEVPLASSYTLDELIEWIGYDVTFLSRQSTMSPGMWSATREVPGSKMFGDDVTKYGETPLEAVYNLCIAIKSPNDTNHD